MLALRNLLPILWSIPMALATSSTSAPVASQRALMLLMLLIRCARNALAAYTSTQRKMCLYSKSEDLLVQVSHKGV